MARYVFKTANRTNGADDCAVNALCLTVGGNWLANFRALCRCGEITKSMPNTMLSIEKYMMSHHYVPVPHGRMTVGQFADTHPDGVYYVICASHATAVIGGVIYDRLNPSRMKIKAAYLISQD